MRLLLLICSFFLLITNLQSQGMVQVKGVVYDADSNTTLDSVTIIVKHTSRIIQNKQDGSFSVFVKPTDTLIFGLYGYKVKIMCFKDSGANKDFVNIKVRMLHLSEEIREVSIVQVRTQRDIRQDMYNLMVEHTFSLDGPDAMQSPISYFYSLNSKKTQTHQMLVEYEFQLAKNRLIMQLLDIYNKQGIIDMPQDQYKEFIEGLNLSWEYLISVSDYDLADYIKREAQHWNLQH